MTVVAIPPTTAAAAAAVAQAEESARIQQETTLRQAQSAKAREVRLERHARRAPDIRDLLDDRNAHAAAVGELRRKLAELESRHAELSTDFERLAKEKAAVQIERNSFKASLDEQIAGRVSDGNVLRDRVSELEQQLATLAAAPRLDGLTASPVNPKPVEKPKGRGGSG